MILKIEPQEYNETEWIRKQSNLRTRQISAKLDKINTAINAINTAYEDVVELYQKTAYEHDDLADIVLARIARKYGHIFDVWGVFISEDIIAVKGKFHTLIDCKVISDDKGFPFDRVEDNQKLAMRMFQKKCGELCYFALKLTDASVWLISMERIETLKGRGKKRLTEDEIRSQSWSLENWLEASHEWSKDI